MTGANDDTQKRLVVRGAALRIADPRCAVGRIPGPHAARRYDRADDQRCDRDGGRPDPAARLLRLARRASAQELAALGAGRRPGAVDDLADAGDWREGPAARQLRRYRVLRAHAGRTVLFLHRRRQALVQRLTL